MFGGGAGLIFNKRNGVLVIFSLEREVRCHHGERDVATHIQPSVVAAAEVRQGANHLEPEAVQKDESAQRRAAGEEGFQQFAAEDDHIASLRFVHFIEPSPLLEGKITYLI